MLTAVFGVRVHAEEPEEAAAATRYLQIDEDAKGELASVDALAARQEWRKAIDICQKWIAGSPKMVLEARPGVYASVRSVAEQRLRSLPAPARLLYRAVHDAEAERLYRTAREERDVAAARRLAGEFALTTHGPAGMNLLGTLLLERGDAAGALDAWQRWASEPEAASVPEPERRRTAVKMALAAARLGDGAALRQASEVLGAKGSAVDAGGTAVSGADELDRLSRALLPPAAASRPATPADLDFERWGSPLWPGRSDIGVRGRRSYMPDLAYSCFGQLAEGVAYVATPEGTEAIDTATGRRIWQRTGKGYERDSYESFFALEFFCRVYPAEGAAGKRTVFSSAGLRLDALDAETGEPLWSRSRGWFGAIVAGGNVPGVAPAFTSPVVCCGHSACVIVQAASGSRYVVALDRATGAIRWWTGIGGGPSAEGARFAEPSDLAAVGSDLIFCSGA
ncbi:MAG: PQQ-binding-like beta-propeller repeat protein, partial [Opitutaceae bacterium]